MRQKLHQQQEIPELFLFGLFLHAPPTLVVIGIHLDDVHGSLIQYFGVGLSQVTEDPSCTFAVHLQDELYEEGVIVIEAQEVH